jgi:hypothetical protein
VLLPASGEPRRIAAALAALAADAERRTTLGLAAAKLAATEFWSWQDRLNAELREVEALAAGEAAGVTVDV